MQFKTPGDPWRNLVNDARSLPFSIWKMLLKLFTIIQTNALYISNNSNDMLPSGLGGFLDVTLIPAAAVSADPQCHNGCICRGFLNVPAI